MASLNELVQTVYDIVNPLPRAKNSIDIEDYKSAARLEYAAAMWIYRQEQRNLDGQFQMPSDLLTDTELNVVNDEADISGLKFLSALPDDLWIQNLGGINCECKYVKTNINLAQVLCDDESLGSDRRYYVSGKKIKFPDGTHANKIPITYANNGNDVDDDVEVNEYIGSKVRDKLLAVYGKKLPVDVTNNSNPNG